MPPARHDASRFFRRNYGPALHSVCATVAAIIALAVLVGWTLDNDALKQIVPTFVAMNPMTATCLLAAAVALAFAKAPVPQLAAGSIIFIAGLKILEASFDTPLQVDRLLFGGSLTEGFGASPNRMAPNTAAALFALGWALITMRIRGRASEFVTQALAGLVVATALFAFIGYILRLAPLYGVERHIPMALHTALALLVLAIGIFSAQGDAGLMRVVRDDGTAGRLARTMLPLAVLIPVLVGLARLEGQRAELYGTETGVALQVIANVVATFLLLFGIILALFRSDTARRQREAAIAQSEEQYRLAERIASVGHWRMQLPSRDLTWSAQMFQIAGKRPTNGVPTASQVLEIYHPDDRATARGALIKALKTGEGWDFIVRLMRPDGGMRSVRSHGVSERDDAGNTRAIFGVFADVTDLEQARRAAEAATEEKAAFLANMSHEIRTPLNGIIGFTDLLMQNAPADPKQRRHLELIQNAGYALLTVVNDILDFSKMDAGKVELEREVFAFVTFVDNTVSIVQGTAEAKGLALRVHLDRALSSYHCGDEGRLRQVLLNLLNNAVKFTASGSITVTVDRLSADGRNERLRVSVSDTGRGIEEGKETRLFQQFSQADASVSREYGGTGLGLAISKRLIELMGGEIGYASNEGRGSTFWFEVDLPIGEKPAELATPIAPAAVRSANILLAEDLPMNQELACAILEQAGHRVDIANDGGEAVVAVKAKDYDLVLMDIQMPKVDGLAATRRIRALKGSRGRIPIIAMTANVLPEQVAEFRRAGMDGHVAKPINQPALHAAIAQVLDNTPAPFNVPPAAEGLAEFDAESFADVAAMLPSDRLETHLSTMEKQLKEILVETDAHALKSAAHKLVSQAGMLGFKVLSEHCRDLDQASDAGASLVESREAVRAAARRVLGMLPNLRRG